MKICFICTEYPPGPHGGVGTFTSLTARYLVKHGHEVRIVGVYYKYYVAKSYEEDNGVKIWRFYSGDHKFGWIGAWIKQYMLIKSWVNKKEIDIIEAPDSRGWYSFWPKMNIPLLLRSNGSHSYFTYLAGDKMNKLTYFLERRSYSKADYFISVSKYTADMTNKIFKKNIKFEIIYNGIESIKLNENGNKSDINRIIFSGTLLEKKGIIYLIEAMNILYNKNIEFVLEIYGKNPLYKNYGTMKDYLIKYKINPAILNRIHFNQHISRENLFSIYQNSSVAVFPSLAEAFAIAPMEAMSCGCPTIYSSNGSGNELIDNGVDGLLIKPDDPEAIAEAIIQVLLNKEFAAKLIKNALEKVTKFSINNLAEQSLQFYLKCLEDYKIKKLKRT